MSKTGIKLNQAVWKNGAIILTNPLQYAILKFFLHTIPIFFIDALLALYGHPLRYGRSLIANIVNHSISQSATSQVIQNFQ